MPRLAEIMRPEPLVVAPEDTRGGGAARQTPEKGGARIGEVYRVMEGPVAPMDCVSEDLADQTCPLIPGCETRPVWLKVRDSIVEALDSTTLADLIAGGRPSRARRAEDESLVAAGPAALVS